LRSSTSACKCGSSSETRGAGAPVAENSAATPNINTAAKLVAKAFIANRS